MIIGLRDLFVLSYFRIAHIVSVRALQDFKIMNVKLERDVRNELDSLRVKIRISNKLFLKNAFLCDRIIVAGAARVLGIGDFSVGRNERLVKNARRLVCYASVCVVHMVHRRKRVFFISLFCHNRDVVNFSLAVRPFGNFRFG